MELFTTRDVDSPRKQGKRYYLNYEIENVFVWPTTISRRMTSSVLIIVFYVFSIVYILNVRVVNARYADIFVMEMEH